MRLSPIFALLMLGSACGTPESSNQPRQCNYHIDGEPEFNDPACPCRDGVQVVTAPSSYAITQCRPDQRVEVETIRAFEGTPTGVEWQEGWTEAPDVFRTVVKCICIREERVVAEPPKDPETVEVP